MLVSILLLTRFLQNAPSDIYSKLHSGEPYGPHSTVSFKSAMLELILNFYRIGSITCALGVLRKLSLDYRLRRWLFAVRWRWNVQVASYEGAHSHTGILRSRRCSHLHPLHSCCRLINPAFSARYILAISFLPMATPAPRCSGIRSSTWRTRIAQ